MSLRLARPLSIQWIQQIKDTLSLGCLPNVYYPSYTELCTVVPLKHGYVPRYLDSWGPTRIDRTHCSTLVQSNTCI